MKKRKKKKIPSPQDIKKAKEEQYQRSIKMGYFTQEEINKYKRKKSKRTKKKSNPIAKIFYGYNTNK